VQVEKVPAVNKRTDRQHYGGIKVSPGRCAGRRGGNKRKSKKKQPDPGPIRTSLGQSGWQIFGRTELTVRGDHFSTGSYQSFYGGD